VCRNDFCNRSINREEMENYSLELIEILLKGEEISTRNIELIKKNRDLLLEKSQSKELLETYKDLQKKELELLSRMGKEIESSREKIIENRRQLRIIKIRKINLKRKKLQLSGILQL
jgi:vacuolar-type H+-ATPase subunit H